MKLYKRVICIFISFVFLSTSYSIYAIDDATLIPLAYDKYVLKCLPDLISNVSKNTTLYNISMQELRTAYISKAFVISGEIL